MECPWLKFCCKMVLGFHFSTKVLPPNMGGDSLVGVLHTWFKKKKAWVGAYYHATYSNYARGDSVIHRSLQFQLTEVRTDPEGCYVLMHALGTSILFIIVGIYLPPAHDVALLSSVMHMVTSYGLSNVLLAGDFKFGFTPGPG